MKPSQRSSVGLVTETGMFLSMSSPLISGGSLFKSVVFRSSSSLPPIVSEGGGLVRESVGKADLLSDNFDSSHPSTSPNTFAFRSSEVRLLLLDLDPYGGTDSLGMYPLFLKITADVMAQRLSVMFSQLVRLGSLTACWRQANVIPITKGPPSSSVVNYLPISITSVLFKVIELLVSVCLGRFMKRIGVRTSNHPVCLSGRSGYL